MKKLLFSFVLVQAIVAADSGYYTVDLINKSQFPINVIVSKSKVYNPGEAPKQYTTRWDLGPGVSKTNQAIGWKDQFTYKYLILTFTANFGLVGQDVIIKEVYSIPKSYQNTNDFVATIDIQKKTGAEAKSYLAKVKKDLYSSSNSAENHYLTSQESKGWAWVPVVTFAGK